MLLTISSRDSITSIVQIIHLVKCVLIFLIERVSVLAQLFRHRKRRYSTPVKGPSASSSARPISNSIPTLPCFNQPSFSHNHQQSSRTNLPCANSGLRILSLLLSDDPPVEIPVSAINMIQTHLFSHQQQHYR